MSEADSEKIAATMRVWLELLGWDDVDRGIADPAVVCGRVDEALAGPEKDWGKEAPRA